MLEYDNSAFYYFAITLLAIYIIPGTYYAVSEFLRAMIGSGGVGAKPRTKEEKEKAMKLKKENTGWVRLRTSKYMANLVCLVIAWSIFVYLITLVINDGEVSSFDPYQILGIEHGATLSEIKKAYRRLSLKFHPDKNIGNKLAEEMFVKITKAHEALTDEAAKENYEKYGNPDGKQALEVSIGLPKILLDNPKVVLVLYLICMVVVIPATVGWWYSESKQYGEKNIMYDTYNAFYSLLQSSYRLKQLPEILAASAEFRKINEPKPSDSPSLGQLFEKMKKEKLMVKPKFEHPKILRGNLLLHAHLLRLADTLSDEAKKDLDLMLRKAPELMEGMVEISYQRKWLDTSLAAIRLQQCIVQALWASVDGFSQLPVLGEAEIKMITKGPKVQAKTLAEYLRVPDEEKRGLAAMSDEDKAEVLKACSLFPKLKIQTKLFVEEEEETFGEEEGASSSTAVVPAEGQDEVRGDMIFEQDLVTLKVIITRENLKEGETASPVYAPRFPGTLYEGLWLVLTDKTAEDSKAIEATIHAFEKVSDQSRVITHEIRFMAPSHEGKYEMELRVLSDSYLGLDEVLPISYEVLPASKLPEFKPHPEDLELDNEPTLFEQMMAANVDESSDEEEEEEEQAKPMKAQLQSKDKKSVVVEDVESDED